MKELAIHCTIYIQNPNGWNEENPDSDAYDVLDEIRTASNKSSSWDFDFQVYDAEVR